MKTGMEGVRSLLAKHSGVRLGTEGPEALRTDLMNLARHNERFFWVCVGMLVLVFIVALEIVIRFTGSPQSISAVFAATGISVLGVVSRMMRLWKAKVALELMLVLATNLDPDGVKGILGILERKFF